MHIARPSGCIYFPLEVISLSCVWHDLGAQWWTRQTWSLLLWTLCSSMKGTEYLPEWLAFLEHILLPHSSLNPVCILPHLIYIPEETMELCLGYRLEGQRLIEFWRLEQEYWEIQGVRGSLQMLQGWAAKWSEKRWELKTRFRLPSPTWIKASRASDASLFKIQHNLGKSISKQQSFLVQVSRKEPFQV